MQGHVGLEAVTSGAPLVSRACRLQRLPFLEATLRWACLWQDKAEHIQVMTGSSSTQGTHPFSPSQGDSQRHVHLHLP